MNKKEEIIKRIEEHWDEKHFSTIQRDYFIDLFLNLKPKHLLETGFATGTSSLTTCYASQISNAPEDSPLKSISVTIFSGDEERGAKTRAHLEDNFNFKLIQSRSKEVFNSDFFKREYPDGIDFFFVDGGLSFSECLFDLTEAFPYMAKNGVIAVDDYHSKTCPFPDIDRAVDGFYEENRTELEKNFVQHPDGKGTCFLKKK